MTKDRLRMGVVAGVSPGSSITVQGGRLAQFYSSEEFMTDQTEYVPGELSQAEKRATLLNDQRVRQQQQGTTLSQFAQSFADEDRGGRYAAVNKTNVICADAVPQYPAGPDWTADPVPAEAPLNFDVNAQEPTGEHFEIAKSLDQLGEAGLHSPGEPEGGAVEAPSSQLLLGAEPAAPLPNKADDDEPPEAT
jgi:hypothetical protein